MPTQDLFIQWHSSAQVTFTSHSIAGHQDILQTWQFTVSVVRSSMDMFHSFATRNWQMSDTTYPRNLYFIMIRVSLWTTKLNIHSYTHRTLTCTVLHCNVGLHMCLSENWSYYSISSTFYGKCKNEKKYANLVFCLHKQGWPI